MDDKNKKFNFKIKISIIIIITLSILLILYNIDHITNYINSYINSSINQNTNQLGGGNSITNNYLLPNITLASSTLHTKIFGFKDNKPL